MAGISGRDGVVEVDGTAVASINEWDLNEEMKTVETGGFGSLYTAPAPSVISGKGSCKGTYNRGDSAGQGGVDAKFRAGTLVSLTLGVSALSGEAYVCDAYITKIMSGAKWLGEATFGFDFETVGAPTTVPTYA